MYSTEFCSPAFGVGDESDSTDVGSFSEFLGVLLGSEARQKVKENSKRSDDIVE